MRRFAFASCIGILSFASANAQSTQEFSRYTFDIGGGYTMPVGSTSNNRDPGWNVRGGAGYNFSPNFGAMLNVGYDSLGISSTSLINAGATNGDINVFHATIDPVARLRLNGRLNLYLTGGGGVFHRTRDVDFPSFPSSTYTVTRPGFDVGGGVEYGIFGHARVFTEAKWDHIFGAYGTKYMDIIPVSFGFRW
jgi:hypothetical protein